jgi:hypothetical protein
MKIWSPKKRNRRGSESAVYHLYMHKDAGLSGILMPSRQFLDRF